MRDVLLVFTIVRNSTFVTKEVIFDRGRAIDFVFSVRAVRITVALDRIGKFVPGVASKNRP